MVYIYLYINQYLFDSIDSIFFFKYFVKAPSNKMRIQYLYPYETQVRVYMLSCFHR